MKQSINQNRNSNSISTPQVAPAYQDFEIRNDISKFFEVSDKIKKELKIDSFEELTVCLENLYEQIVSEADETRKALKFINGMSNFPKRLRRK